MRGHWTQGHRVLGGVVSCGGEGSGKASCVAWTRTCSGISPRPGVATTFQNAFSRPTPLCSSSCAVSRLTRPFPILHPRVSIPLPTGATECNHASSAMIYAFCFACGCRATSPLRVHAYYRVFHNYVSILENGIE